PAANIYPVILAGGASSRLWPASGVHRPKWALQLGLENSGGQNLLQAAWQRARTIAARDRCYVVTGAAQAARVRKELPQLPAANLLVEPEPRDTAGAVAFAAGVIVRQCPSDSARAMVLVLPGDHLIQPLAEFKRSVEAGAEAAS